MNLEFFNIELLFCAGECVMKSLQRLGIYVMWYVESGACEIESILVIGWCYFTRHWLWTDERIRKTISL